jgi:hypothetical protein
MFAGYIDSAALRSYPAQSLIPAYLKYGVKNVYGAAGTQALLFKNQIVVVKDSTIRLLNIADNSLSTVDSFNQAGIIAILPLNDSQFCIEFNIITGNAGSEMWDTTYLKLLNVNTTGFFISSTSIGRTYISQGLNYINCAIYAGNI